MLAGTRPYDVDIYRRSVPAMNLMLHNQSLPDGYGSSPYATKRDTPELESKTGVSHRKRVPVACERCRKRKIKCSGDQGDGTGCDNCKSAGWEGCQFLRVRSWEQTISQPLSSSRNWHHQHHYHPYSVRSRGHHHLHQAHAYHQSGPLPYPSWQTTVDYPTVAVPSTSMQWNTGNFNAAYTGFDGESTSPYAAQPPSYMLPDPDTAARNIGCYSSFSRSQQNSLWAEQMNSASLPQQNTQAMSPVYPLTPAESTKSYSLLGGLPAQTLSNERAMPVSTMAAVLTSAPPNVNDTPPLSAVSQRSAHDWSVDSSEISNRSTHALCGESEDFTAAHALTTSEDQAAIYPYPTTCTSTGSEINVPATALPIAMENSDQQQQHFQSDLAPNQRQEVSTSINTLASRGSRESLRVRTSSPGLYGYTNSHRSARRSHNLLTSRLVTGGYPSNWHAISSPSPNASRNNSLTEESTQVSNTKDYSPTTRASISSSLANSSGY